MRFGSRTVGLLVGVLLAAAGLAGAAGGAQAASPAAVGPARSTFAGDVAVIWLYVVQGGQSTRISLTADQLVEMPGIRVDGYISGVVLLSTAPLTLSVARKPMRPIRENGHGVFDLKYYGQLSRREFLSTFLSSPPVPTRANRIQGYYASFARVPGDALCDDPEFRISVDRNGLEHHLNIRQAPGRKIETGDAPAASGSGPEFFYRGDDLARFGGSRDAADRRVQAILTGIRAVESTARRPLVDRVSVIDYEDRNNAYTCQGESGIWIYAPLFWNESLAELRTIAEHETLHILSDRLGLPASSRLREDFARLKGYDRLSMERFWVVTTGRAPAAPSRNRPAVPSHLFDFINEVNFLRGMKGGHAADDVDEFCASFLHTLMYIDRFADLLDQPLITRTGQVVPLTAPERARLLEDYQMVLETMANEIPRSLDQGVRALFGQGRQAAGRIADDAHAPFTPVASRQPPAAS